MLRAGYNVKMSAGRDHRRRLPWHPHSAVGDADRLRRDGGVSVVQLYAGAFLPGIMLAGLYIAYVMILAKLRRLGAAALRSRPVRGASGAHLAAVAKSRDERALTGLWRNFRTAPSSRSAASCAQTSS
jgi:hypothetical protein